MHLGALEVHTQQRSRPLGCVQPADGTAGTAPHPLCCATHMHPAQCTVLWRCRVHPELQRLCAPLSRQRTAPAPHPPRQHPPRTAAALDPAAPAASWCIAETGSGTRRCPQPPGPLAAAARPWPLPAEASEGHHREEAGCNYVMIPQLRRQASTGSDAPNQPRANGNPPAVQHRPQPRA